MTDFKPALSATADGAGIDLHTHTTASDGTLAPDALVARARAAGVGLLAITDHDTTAGYRALDPARHPGITVVPGVELSCLWRRLGIHVVGLAVDPHAPAMTAACRHQAAARAARATVLAERLARQGVGDALAGARREAGEAELGRVHFARFLVRTGAARDMQRAFRRYLRDDASTLAAWPSLAVAIDWIHAAGGIAVLAHPAKYRLTRGRLEHLAEAFRAAGGDALEVISGCQSEHLTRELAALARRHALGASQGSDFHQPGQAWAALGALPPLPRGTSPVWRTTTR